MRHMVSVGVLVTLLSAPSFAAPVIDFSADGSGAPLAPGTVIADQYANVGVRFVGSAFDEPDNEFDNFASNTDMRLTTAGGDVPLFPTIPGGAGNFLHTYSGFVAENGDANLAILFDTPIFSCTVDIYDDTVGLTQMFAIEGEDILDDTQSIETSDGARQTLTVSSTTPFTMVGLILGSNADWVGLDNIAYVAVPEPSVLGLLSAALFSRALFTRVRCRRVS